MRHIYTIVCASLLCATTLFAQNQDEQETLDQQIEYNVSVTADRLEEPLADKSDSITVVTSKEIERHQWKSVGDALRHVSGVTPVRSGSPGKNTSLFLRGADTSQVLLLIDGIQMNDPYFGDLNLENMSTENIERIEIVKGPQSPLYGSESIGGVINIITKRGKGDAKIEGGFEAGSFNTFHERAGVSGSVNQIAYSLGFARSDTEGQFDNDEFRQNTFSGKGSYRWNANTEIALTTRVQDAQIGIPFNFVNFPPESPNRNQETSQSIIGANIRHSHGAALDFTGRISFTHLDFLFEDPDDFFPFSEHTSNVVQFGFQNDMLLTEFDTLTLGYEYETQAIDARDAGGEIADLNDYDSDIHAVYAQNKVESDRWIITTGLRMDHHSTFGSTWNPRVSVAFRPVSGWKIRSSYGTGFRAPTAGDLAFPFYGNPDLQPEKSKSWEAGVERYWGDLARISATWFHNDFEDLITFDPVTFLAGNVAEAKSRGAEVEGSLQYRRWFVTAAYTYLDTEDEIQQRPLFRRPKHSASLRLAYDSGRWGWNVALYSVSERFESDFSTFPPSNVFNPGYSKTDVAGYVRINGKLRVTGRIENLFDSDYEEVLLFQAPGIAAFAGIEFAL